MYLDSPLGDSLYSVASFSSVGPTYDGRIKPDIIAPGDFIESAYSGSPDLLYRALDPSQNSKYTFQVRANIRQFLELYFSTTLIIFFFSNCRLRLDRVDKLCSSSDEWN